MEQLRQLFASWAGHPCDECLALGANGSSRRYYRLKGGGLSAIGCIADDLRENEAMGYYRHLGQEESPLQQYSDADHREYAISTQNYATFYNRKDPVAYEAFFKKYHLKNINKECWNTN